MKIVHTKICMNNETSQQTIQNIAFFFKNKISIYMMKVLTNYLEFHMVKPYTFYMMSIYIISML